MNDIDLLVSCWLIPLPQCKKYYQTKHKELVDSEEALSKAGQAPATDKTEKVRSVYSATDKTEKVYSLYSLISSFIFHYCNITMLKIHLGFCRLTLQTTVP